MKKKDNSNDGRGSIRRRLTGAVLIPSVTFLLMWTVVSSYMFYDGFSARQVGLIARQVSIPSVAAMVALERERQLSIAYLSRSGPYSLSELHNQQQQVDKPLQEYRKAADPLISSAPASISSSMTTLNNLLDQLSSIRSKIEMQQISQPTAGDYYNRVFDSATILFYAEAHLDNLSVSTSQAGDASIAIFHVSDIMSRAATIASSDIGAGSFPVQDQLEFARLVGSYHADLDKTLPLLPPADQDTLRRLQASSSWKGLVDAENALIAHGAWSNRVPIGLPTNEADWLALANPVAKSLADVSMSTGDKASALAISAGTDKLTGVIVGSLIALVTAIVAIIAAVRISSTLVDRTLVTRLQRLQNDAMQLGKRLPEIVQRLREGASVNIQAELPELAYGQDEIGQVATAFNHTQRTAVSAAVEEARSRDGVHNVFLGIAHRNQGLVHRQLKILDAMERDEESPEQLERLFQIDHLATQSRRNAENLMILGGEQPGRRWRKPARLVDVLRASVAETEQYARVQVSRVPEVAIVGTAVADTIHLIAELVDNATSFSPPPSPVPVTSTRVAKGVVVEVEDQGLGMSDEVRERANVMMAEPPTFDAMALKADPRLGLFVVARLAARLGVEIEFRTSPYGGTRVIILIPSRILASEEGGDGETDTPPQLPRRARHLQQSEGEEDSPGSVVNGTELAKRRVDRTRRREFFGNGVVEFQQNVDQPVSGIAEHQIGRVPSQPAGVTETPATTVRNEASHRPQLPQRRPQQNIAPQLLSEAVIDTAEPTDGRSAEEIQRTMSAFQKGSIQGRQAGDSLDS